MDRQIVAKLLVGLGVVLVAVGVFGLVTGDGDAASETVAPATTTTSDPPLTTAPSTTSPTTSSTTTTTTPTTPGSETRHMRTTTSTSTITTSTVPVVAAESPAEFFAVLKGALDGGDAPTLVARLNAATVERYGAEQCQAYAESVAGTGLDADRIATRELASWDYTTDERTTTLVDVVAADLERTVNGLTLPQTTHWQLVDGRYTWFTDCGSPV